MEGITFEMMQDPEKHGLIQCPHCNGYGSSLHEPDLRCTRCGGTGLIRKHLTDQQLIEAYAGDLTSYRITKVVMRGERFVIFRTPGHRFQNGQTWEYGRSDHTLIRQGESWRRGKLVKVWEGRVSKKELQKALLDAEAAAKQ